MLLSKQSYLNVCKPRSKSVFTLISHWSVIMTLTFFVISCCDYFGFYISTANLKLLQTKIIRDIALL